MVIYKTDKFELSFHPPTYLVCKCTEGYYVDENDNFLGKQMEKEYQDCYDPKTLQLKPIKEGIYTPYQGKIYWLHERNSVKELVYDSERKSKIV